jgi:hypothetical protein
MKAHADTILPLRFQKDTKLTKDQYTTFKLPTDPTSANSPTYDYVARHVTGDEGTRYAIKYRKKDLETIWRGHNVTTVDTIINTNQIKTKTFTSKLKKFYVESYGKPAQKPTR